MSPLEVILLLGMMGAQNQSVPAQQTQVQAGQDAAQKAGERASFGKADCYAIRSYLFRREDGNAPVLVGTSTCTPANTVRPERVSSPPKVRLVPQ